MKAGNLLPWLLIVIGVVLVAAPMLTALAELIVDAAPPEIVETFPAKTTYSESISVVRARVRDAVSGVKGVYVSIAWGGEYKIRQLPLTLVSGDSKDGVWEANLATPLTEPTQYIAIFQAGDEADNWLNHMVEFYITYNLKGRWFINDIEITSPDQKVYLKTTTITFKFVETEGPPPTHVTVTVSWTGTTTGSTTLPFLQMQPEGTPPTWQKTLTFPEGTYSVVLKATDGTHVVQLSLMHLQIGEKVTLPLTQLLGVGLIAIGAVIYLRRR